MSMQRHSAYEGLVEAATCIAYMLYAEEFLQASSLSESRDRYVFF